ncbi:AI-2E family transporter [Halonotius terrestris]|uniref:AI-2E family transporter n=1 Tax=Halonotius terrestris TaxID=2487750 RepID=A0A8J8TD01_9EURY|nr:AI-2E family transporter [Halonotius terrestris]TQQ82561.1 AI-2E family transporter [Halonotius terrestris]
MSLRQTLHDHPLWILLGIVLFGALGYVLAAFVGTVIVAVFVYYAARPIYRQLTDRIENRTAAAGISIIALVLPAIALVGYALLIVTRQLREVADVVTVRPQDLGISPELYNRLTDPTFFVSGEFRQLFSGELAGSVIDSLASVAGAATTVGVIVINLFAMVVLAFYLLRDDRRLAGWVNDQFETDDSIVSDFGRAVDRDLSSIFFGNILNAIITGTIAVIVYSLLNVIAPEGAAIPAAALVGLLAGVASLIPVIGMKIVYVPVALYMAARGVMTAGGETLWFVVLFTAVSVVIIDLIPDMILRPYVSGKNIHIGLLMLAYILGPLFFGWYGLFLMPALLVVAVQFARIVVPALVDEAADPQLPPSGARIDANPLLRTTVGTAAPETTDEAAAGTQPRTDVAESTADDDDSVDDADRETST